MLSRKMLPVVLLCAMLSLNALAGEVEPPGPVIETIEPDAIPMPGGAEVTIRGTGFNKLDATKMKVTFGGEPAPTFEVISPEEIRAVTPKLDTEGRKTVEVSNPDGQSDKTEMFRYGDEPGPVAAIYRQFRAIWAFIRADRSHIIYPLIAMSILAIAWTVHCLLVVRQSQILPDAVRAALFRHIIHNNLRAALNVCDRNECVLSRVVVAGLRKAGENDAAVREAIQATGSRESAMLLQKISYLSNIGTIAPMLGLLGTVWGMILAFQAQAGMAGNFPQTTLLMAAVSTAMNTTAAGLIVGIPAMAFYFFLRGRTVQLMTELEVACEEAVHAFENRGKAK